ncbi:23375_t:CDS:1, partial [Racocetra persica]
PPEDILKVQPLSVFVMVSGKRLETTISLVTFPSKVGEVGDGLSASCGILDLKIGNRDFKTLKNTE